MTTMYRTEGKLVAPVTDLPAARAYLAEPMEDYVQYSDLPDPSVVFTIRWDLTGEDAWQVTVVTLRPLTPGELTQLSSWISGQNSDGLGEGFEQQPFAETYDTDRYGDIDEDTYQMASFDWQDNPCKLERVKG